MEVVKASGEKEAFDEGKLRHSLEKAGADKKISDYIVEHVKKEISDGAETKEIFKHALELLKKEEKPLAARYSLKKAIMDLGPSGFPFESFIAEILSAMNFQTETNKHIKGKCVEHEVDVLAKDKDKIIVVEAKFRNRPGFKTDLKSALYVFARYQDLLDSNFSSENKENLKPEGWLLTNEKFTQNAVDYGRCAGLTLVGWGYPERGNLQDLIEETGVHPLTALTTLTEEEKKRLVERKIVLCKKLAGEPEALSEVGVSKGEIDKVFEEIKLLCRPEARS